MNTDNSSGLLPGTICDYLKEQHELQKKYERTIKEIGMPTFPYHLDRAEKLQRIYEHFGFQNQADKLKEEACEFADAYAAWVKSDWSSPAWDHLIEELADVTIILSQLKNQMIRLDDTGTFFDQLDTAIENKIKRTNKRIEEGYYEDPSNK